MTLANVKESDFCQLFLRIGTDHDGADKLAVYLQDEVVAETLPDFLTAPGYDFLVVHGAADEADDALNVGFAGRADLLIGVGIDHGAHAFDAEEFAEQGVIGAAVEEVGPGDAAFAGPGGVPDLDVLEVGGWFAGQEHCRSSAVG